MKQRLIDANDVDNHIIGSVDLRDCPTIEAIPIEWLKNKVKEAVDERRVDDALFLKECLAKWEKENEAKTN